MKESFVNVLMMQSHLPLPLMCMAELEKADVVKMVCAYLNDSGGWIVVGVDRTKVVGVDDDAVRVISEEIIHHVLPLPLVYVEEDEYKGCRVLLITVNKGSTPPYSYNSKYYVIQDGVAVQPEREGMALLLRNPNIRVSRWESDTCLTADSCSLDVELMDEVYEKGIRNGRLRKNESRMNYTLSELGLLTVSEVSNGAVVMFASDTRKILPQCKLRIQLMSNDKSADQYDDVQFFEGNIFYILKKTIAYFKERLPYIYKFSGNESLRHEDFLYPIEVIDEAVSNALIHRDYTNRVDEVSIFIYKDRLEITNSGEMPHGLLASKNKVIPHGSILRNPLMAEVFYISGNMEKTGRGLQLISDKMRAVAKKLPEWRSTNGKTTLVIYSQRLELSLNHRSSCFIKKMGKGVLFTKVDYMNAFDKQISKGTAQNDIKTMLELGFVKSIGSGPSTKYVIHKIV